MAVSVAVVILFHSRQRTDSSPRKRTPVTRTNVRFNSSLRSTYSIIWNNLANKLILSYRCCCQKTKIVKLMVWQPHTTTQRNRQFLKHQNWLGKSKNSLSVFGSAAATLKHTQHNEFEFLSFVASWLLECVARHTPSTHLNFFEKIFSKHSSASIEFGNHSVYVALHHYQRY